MDLRWMKTSRPMARLLQQDAKSLSQCLENRALRHPPHRSPSFGGETMAAVSLSFAGVPLPRLRAHPDRARSKPLNVPASFASAAVPRASGFASAREAGDGGAQDRKSTRLNSSHLGISD